MSRVNRNWARLLTAGTCYAYIAFGFADNLRGPTMPAVLQDRQLDYAQGGSLLFAAYGGYVFGNFSAGLLSDRLGNKKVLALAGLLAAAGMAAFSLLGTFWSLVPAMVVMGLGLGYFETGGNALIADLHSDQPGKYLNLLGVFHSIGATLVPLYAGYLLTGGTSWRRVYQYALPVVLLVPIYLLAVRDPAQSCHAGERRPRPSLWQTAFGLRMGWYYLLATAYIAGEIGLASWLVEFLQKTKGQSIIASSVMLSLFFAGIGVGRFLGTLVVERIGYLRLVLIACLGAVVCIGLGTFGPPELAILLSLTGLFFSVIFPTTAAVVSDRVPENRGVMLGLLFTFGGLGGTAGPWLIGVLSDWVGIQFGFGLLLAYGLLATFAVLMIMGQPAQAAETTQPAS